MTSDRTPPPPPDSRRRALGRGLEALLPSRLTSTTQTPARIPTVQPGVAASVSASTDSTPAGTPLDIALNLIDRNPFQTRRSFDPEKLTELAQSITASGVVQPIVVRPLADGRYQLITGERRLLASRQAGRPTIPAIVRHASNAQAMEMTIVENLQRADLNPMEQARAYQRLSSDFHLTQDQMAQRTGKDRASIANFLRLLRLPEVVQARVESGELAFGHARTLLSLPSSEQMIAAAQKVSSLAMSVRQAETYVQGLLNPDARLQKSSKPVKQPLDPNVLEAQQRLQRRLGLRIRIEDRRGKGRVIIDYANLEDFDLLLDALMGNED